MAGLYIHIPFCQKKCDYCDFLSFANCAPMGKYLGALKNEMALCAKRAETPGKFYTVFIGGGTPSLLGADEAASLLAAANESFNIADNAEITMECNPGTAHGKLKEYRHAGVNRLSIGMQAAQDELLRAIGRVHTRAQFIAAFSEAREAGFTNINVDVMAGLPGQSADDYRESLLLAAQLGAQHVSAYALTLEPHTPLYERVNSGEAALPGEDEFCSLLLAGQRLLRREGYARYEISNYAREGHECRHNLNYWRNGKYLGVGLGAHSALNENGWTRRENTSDLNKYFEMTQNGTLPLERTQRIPKREEMFETLMLGLRLVGGVELDVFTRRFAQDLLEAYPVCAALQKEGLLLIKNGHAFLNEHALEIQNTVLLRFMEE